MRKLRNSKDVHLFKNPWLFEHFAVLRNVVHWFPFSLRERNQLNFERVFEDRLLSDHRPYHSLVKVRIHVTLTQRRWNNQMFLPWTLYSDHHRRKQSSLFLSCSGYIPAFSPLRHFSSSFLASARKDHSTLVEWMLAYFFFFPVWQFKVINVI